ncbi:MAG: glycosyltransferase family 4 protein [Candidatus Delongbacteria bacterium]|nr:glycosyltransferase family 4 protein [Candidatus Delongbacteria bacterium]
MKIKNNIIFSVFDPLFHEYRGFKVACSFEKKGWKSIIIGTKYSNAKLLGWNNIQTDRIRIFTRLPLFVNMIVFWIKLFMSLMITKADILYSHDIFPLLPVYLVSKFKRIPFVYDAHEFWHGNSQVENRPLAKWFWTSYERIFIKAAKKVITVSDSIARELESIYKIDKVKVFTNLPMIKEIPKDRKLLHNSLKLSKDKKIVLYQGRFLVNNGLDTIVKAFQNVTKKAVLVFVGEGSEKPKLESIINELGMGDRVFFIGPFPHDELINYTVCADIGLCLIKNSGKSFFYSTPNKMFEFIQAGVPQIASNFPEMTKIVKAYEVGEVIDPENKGLITDTINLMLCDVQKMVKFKQNCEITRQELVWDSIEEELVNYVVNN